MKVSQIVKIFENIAPPGLAEDWDNIGLLIGDGDDDVRRVLVCIDLTPAVLNEALRLRAGMVMAYHPVIFKSINRLTADKTPVLYKAARAGVAVYCMHTSLDSVPGGLNDALADVLGAGERRPMQPQSNSQNCKIVVFTPPEDLAQVAHAAFAAGAGRIGNYYDCSFFSHGIGSFCGEEGTHPTVGRPGRHEAAEEMRLEIVAPKSKAAAVCSAVCGAHSYEEPAIDVYPMEIYPEGCGLGRIGRLTRPASVASLIGRLKKASGLKKILVAPAVDPTGKSGPLPISKLPAVSTVACFAGVCGHEISHALAAGATFMVTGEMKHHYALEAAAGGMTVACMGHSNSERIGLAKTADKIAESLSGIDVTISKTDRDPFDVW